MATFRRIVMSAQKESKRLYGGFLTGDLSLIIQSFCYIVNEFSDRRLDWLQLFWCEVILYQYDSL